MYFFYIDESGSRDPQVFKKKSDGTVANKDHIYVLTAISLPGAKEPSNWMV